MSEYVSIMVIYNNMSEYVSIIVISNYMSKYVIITFISNTCHNMSEYVSTIITSYHKSELASTAPRESQDKIKDFIGIRNLFLPFLDICTT